MINLIGYYVINGEKSTKQPLIRDVKDKAELEKVRKELEEKENCFETSFWGKKRVKDIVFIYKEKI